MIERVARAIAVARGMDPDARSVTAFNGMPRDCKVWESLIPSARAAIEAVGAQIEAMALLGDADAVIASKVFGGVVDAALKER